MLVRDQLAVIELVNKGWTASRIARVLGISPTAVSGIYKRNAGKTIAEANAEQDQAWLAERARREAQ